MAGGIAKKSAATALDSGEELAHSVVQLAAPAWARPPPPSWAKGLRPGQRYRIAIPPLCCRRDPAFWPWALSCCGWCQPEKIRFPKTYFYNRERQGHAVRLPAPRRKGGEQRRWKKEKGIQSGESNACWT